MFLAFLEVLAIIGLAILICLSVKCIAEEIMDYIHTRW